MQHHYHLWLDLGVTLSHSQISVWNPTQKVILVSGFRLTLCQTNGYGLGLRETFGLKIHFKTKKMTVNSSPIYFDTKPLVLCRHFRNFGKRWNSKMDNSRHCLGLSDSLPFVEKPGSDDMEINLLMVAHCNMLRQQFNPIVMILSNR